MKEQWIFLLVCTLLIIAMVLGARLVETDFGRVNVSIIHFPDPSGITLVAKLYVPDTASVNNNSPQFWPCMAFRMIRTRRMPFPLNWHAVALLSSPSTSLVTGTRTVS